MVVYGPCVKHANRPFELILLQKAFKEYIGAVILHKNAATGVYYRDDPAILGWEIANAPVCPGDDSGDVLQVRQ